MYSGKRHRCGFNIQVVSSWHGTLTLTGKPQRGSMHDAKAWRESGQPQCSKAVCTPTAAKAIPPTPAPACVPVRKPKGQTLTSSAREFNRIIASQRASIERVIAHVKNWKLLATGYRGLLDRFPTFLDAITKLEIYRTS